MIELTQDCLFENSLAVLIQSRRVNRDDAPFQPQLHITSMTLMPIN